MYVLSRPLKRFPLNNNALPENYQQGESERKYKQNNSKKIYMKTDYVS